MFGICEAMKWNHLPVPGGIYAQHPDFLDDIRYIFTTRGAYEEAERKKEEAKRNRETKGATRGARPRRR